MICEMIFICGFRWKIQEASLCAVGRSADDIILGMKDEKRNVQFDIKSLFDHVIMDSMRATGKIQVYFTCVANI